MSNVLQIDHALKMLVAMFEHKVLWIWADGGVVMIGFNFIIEYLAKGSLLRAILICSAMNTVNE